MDRLDEIRKYMSITDKSSVTKSSLSEEKRGMSFLKSLNESNTNKSEIELLAEELGITKINKVFKGKNSIKIIGENMDGNVAYSINMNTREATQVNEFDPAPVTASQTPSQIQGSDENSKIVHFCKTTSDKFKALAAKFGAHEATKEASLEMARIAETMFKGYRLLHAKLLQQQAPESIDYSNVTEAKKSKKKEVLIDKDESDNKTGNPFAKKDGKDKKDSKPVKKGDMAARMAALRAKKK